MSRHLRAAWRRTLDAPHLPVAIWLAFVGVATLIAGPKSTGEIEHALPLWLTYTWSGSLVAGGVLVTVGVLGASTRPESAGHCMHVFGLGLAGLVFAPRAPFGLDGGGIIIIVVLAAVSLIRLWVLARQRAAEAEAQRQLRARIDGGP